jgi:hypothetical protein
LFAFYNFHITLVCLLLVCVFWDAQPPLAPAVSLRPSEAKSVEIV